MQNDNLKCQNSFCHLERMREISFNALAEISHSLRSFEMTYFQFYILIFPPRVDSSCGWLERIDNVSRGGCILHLYDRISIIIIYIFIVI